MCYIRKAKTGTSRHWILLIQRDPDSHFITCDLLQLLLGNLVTTIYPLEMQEWLKLHLIKFMDARHTPNVVVLCIERELMDSVDKEIRRDTLQLQSSSLQQPRSFRPRPHDQANFLKLISQEHYTTLFQRPQGKRQQQMQNVHIL